jgi:glucan phosphoethanolaminetransferase (alkaline phosphatase superfamily)
MLEGFSKGLEQPEYIHVLINPLPVYGLAIAIIGLIIGLVLRSREARIAALVLILIAAGSAWPTFHYGQQGYDRVKGMSDSEGEKWLDEHMHRAEEFIYVFYALGAVALVSIGTEWKQPKTALALAITTLLLATVTLAIGAYIAYAGGHIRHKEFRFEPAPEVRIEEHQKH